jgi:peptidoglycan hydrolase-like protein with peptidoglycan-binding domain
MKTVLSIAFAIMLLAGGALAQAQTAATTTSTETKASKSPAFRSTKDQVRKAQTMLKEKKLFAGDATGTSSDEWKTAVKEYQSSNGLARTGSLNRATLEKMGIELTDNQKAIPVNPKHFASADSPKASKTTAASAETKSTDGPKRPAPFRANGDQIKAAQRMLKEGKMYTGDESGKLDDATRDAIGKYQQANNVKVTKTLNAATLDKMGIALTSEQKANVEAHKLWDMVKSKKN